jgi:hypothetical protein
MARPNQPLQPTAAAMLVWRSFLSFSAAAAAELGCSAPFDSMEFAHEYVADERLLDYWHEEVHRHR